jgi:hypothetical protein
MEMRRLAAIDLLPSPDELGRRLAENAAERAILMRLNRVHWAAQKELRRLRAQGGAAGGPHDRHSLGVIAPGDAG